MRTIETESLREKIRVKKQFTQISGIGGVPCFMPKPPSKLRGKGSLTDARKREVQIWSDGGGGHISEIGKIA